MLVGRHAQPMLRGAGEHHPSPAQLQVIVHGLVFFILYLCVVRFCAACAQYVLQRRDPLPADLIGDLRFLTGKVSPFLVQKLGGLN